MGRNNRLSHKKNSERKRLAEKRRRLSELTLQSLQSTLELPSSWSDQSSTDLNRLVLCKMSHQAGPSSQPVRISHCVMVDSDFTWSVFVEGLHVEISRCIALKSFPSALDSPTLSQLLKKVDELTLYEGHPDAHFVKMVSAKKGKILSHDGKFVAYVDEVCGSKTVRTCDCELLVSGNKCSSCLDYRANLRAMYSKWSKRQADNTQVSDSSSHTNDRYLNTPEKKKKFDDMKKRMHAAESSVKRLKEKVKKLTEEHGESVDNELHSDLIGIMRNNDEQIKKAYPEGSFSRLFWEEQLKAATSKHPCQVRWHPVMIKWCLNLKLLSSSAYHALRTSGFVKLPSERTLRDYVHYFSNKPGFQAEVLGQLLKEANLQALPPSRRYIALILDEMKIKEGLVYNKYSGEIIGFTHLGDINDELTKLEQDTDHPPIATHVLTFMVRGLLFKLEFPYTHFATRGITAETLCPIVWEAVRILEGSGLQVLCITADGASPNRKFFRMHDKGEGLVHKTKNPFSPDERWIFFIADPPHLIKTVRNCWSHSAVSGTRRMKVTAMCVYIQLYTCTRILTVVYVISPLYNVLSTQLLMQHNKYR